MRTNLSTIFKVIWVNFNDVASMLKLIRFFFLHCLLFSDQRRTILNSINDIDSSLTNINDSNLIHIPLFCEASIDISVNTLTFNAIMNYIISTNRFEDLLYVYMFMFLNSSLYPNVFFEAILSLCITHIYIYI